MPTSAYACGGATGTPFSARGTSAAPYAEPNAASHEQRRRVHAPTRPAWRGRLVARSFTTTSSSRSVGGYGTRNVASLGAEGGC